MQHDRPTDVPGAFRQFVDAVLAFSEDPNPVNLARYLAASRALDEDRREQIRPAA